MNSSTPRRKWSREEVLLALLVYSRLSFGQFNKTNETVIDFAALIGRSPSSFAMKLGNLASLDPSITNSGRVGLPSASALDHLIWAEYSSDKDKTLAEAKAVLKALSDAKG